MTAGLVVLLVIAFLVLLVVGKTVRIIPQARAAVVERLGRFSRTLEPGLAIVRPIARRHMRTPPQIRTGTAALVGARAVVLETVDQDSGTVKIGGEVWTARSFDEDEVYETGTRVEVIRIEGATALVAD